MITIRVKLNPEALTTLTKSPDGLLGRWFQTRGRIAQLAMIRDCPRSGHAAKGVSLSESSQMVWSPTLNGQMVSIVFHKPYAAAVHDGAVAHVIPGNPLLAFPWPKVGEGIFIFRSVNHPGNKPNPWMRRNLRLFGAA